MTQDSPRVLIAGIGNIFFGDDGFGVMVCRALASRHLPAGVHVAEFGTRGFDLACALLSGYGTAILIDAVDRKSQPGKLCVLELDSRQFTDRVAPTQSLSSHSLDPVAVINLAQQMGGSLPLLYLLGCQPATFAPDENFKLSPAVQAAVEPAIQVLQQLAFEHCCPPMRSLPRLEF